MSNLSQSGIISKELECKAQGTSRRDVDKVDRVDRVDRVFKYYISGKDNI